MWLPASKNRYCCVFFRYRLVRGRCSPGILVLKFFDDVFSRYRFYHFQDFTCILPVSNISGITHQKSPAESIYLFSLVFADFCHTVIVFWRIFKIAWTHNSNMICGFFLLPLRGMGGKNCPWLLMYTPDMEKKPFMCTLAIEFLTPVATWSVIRSVHMNSCLTAQKRFLLFKGPGSFKKILKSAEMYRVFKDLSIDTTPTPPFLVILQYL